MAILGMRGWECGNTMLNTADIASGSFSASTSNVKTGTYSLRGESNGNNQARWAFPSAEANPSVSVWVYPNNTDYTSSSALKLWYLLDTGELISLLFNATSKTFDAYVDGGLVESGTVQVSVQDLFHVQFYVTVADAGTIQVKINGHLSIDYSGDTKPQAGTTGVTYFYWQSFNAGGHLDDLVWGNDGYLGDLRCIDIRPNADTAQDDWTPSTGSDNYAMIDETPQNDTDYNSTSTSAHADELDMTDFDGTSYVPRALSPWVRAKADTANGDSIDVGLDSGGTDAVTKHALSASYEYYFHIADDDPNTATEWIDAGVDAVKLRYVSDIA